MTNIALPNVSAYQDRHGKTRYRFRRRGYRTVHLPGLPGSPEFMEAYAAALQGGLRTVEPIGARKVIPRTLSACIVAYYGSAGFQGLRETTRRQKRMVLERMRPAWGDKPIAHLSRANIQDMMNRLALQPGAANIRLKVLRAMLAHAEDIGLIPKGSNPAAGVKLIKSKTEGFRQWSEGEIDQFLEHHKPGSKPRLALMLLLYTCQRRSDVVRMGRQMVSSGTINFRQQKTGTELTLPILPALADELERVKGQMTFLQTDYGKPFTSAGFGMRFRAWCREANLNGLSPHGLRKAGATRLAEHGASHKELQAWTGIKDFATLEIYIRKSDQRRLAEGAKEGLARNEKRATVGEP
jgi:integrase